MIRYLHHPDLGAHLFNTVMTAGSMGLSGYCGWLIADGSGVFIQAITAAVFSMIAFGLSLMVVRRERYTQSMSAAEVAQDRTAYILAQNQQKKTARAVWFLLAANLLTDYSASAALRNVTITAADNTNVVAINARTEVTRLEAKERDLKGERAWINKYESPASYDAMISEQMQITDKGSNVFARTKGCTDTTLPISQSVCQRIKQLEADRANATRRQVVLAELTTIGEQLAAAKQAVSETPKAGNAAMAPIVQLVQMLTQSLDNDKSNVQWGLNYFVLFMTAIFSAGIYYFSSELGSRMGPMPAAVAFQTWQPKPKQKWLEAPEPVEPDEPIQLKSEPVPGVSSSVTIHKTSISKPNYDQGAIDRLMRELEDDFGLKRPH